MRILNVETPGRYDCLYVSAHAHDAALSNAGRILGDSRRGLRILLVTLFDEGEGVRTVDALPVDHLLLGLPAAPRRSPAHRSFRSVLYGREEADDALLPQLAARLDEIGNRTRARHVFVPLAVGGHIDHRLAHEAALRVFHGGAERDVFLYEDRPYAFVPGAVSIRLGQLGAWLPPAALPAARGAGLLRFLFRYHFSPQTRTHLKGLRERLRCTSLAAGQWREARAWRPQKALGLRLQPVVQAVEAGDVVSAATACPAGLAALCGSDAGFGHLAADYSRRLGATGHAERYWLMLPQRDDILIAPLAAAN